MSRPEIKFTVWGTARPKGSARAFVPKGWTRPIITSDNQGLKAWEDTIRATLQDVMNTTPAGIRGEIFDAPVALMLIFHLPRPKAAKHLRYSTKKPDLDKLVRGAIDAMNGILFHDDAQVVAISARKLYADGGARLDVTAEAWVEPTYRKPPKEIGGLFKEQADASETV